MVPVPEMVPGEVHESGPGAVSERGPRECGGGRNESPDVEWVLVRYQQPPGVHGPEGQAGEAAEIGAEICGPWCAGAGALVDFGLLLSDLLDGSGAGSQPKRTPLPPSVEQPPTMYNPSMPVFFAQATAQAPAGGSGTGNGKCAAPIMQPTTYTHIFGAMGTDLHVNALFIMSTALQESGWNLVHVFQTNSLSHDLPLNNLFGMTDAGKSNLPYSNLQASAQAWERDWGPYLANHPQTITAYTADLLSNPKHMYNANPAWPGAVAARYKQLKSATSACGTTF